MNGEGDGVVNYQEPQNLNMVGADVTEWCLGLPLTEQRILTNQERLELKTMASHLRGRGISVWVLYLILVSTFALAAVHTDSSAGTEQAILAVSSIVLTLLGLPLTILIGRDAWDRSRRLTADLRLGTITGYEGTFTLATAEATLGAALPHLRREGLLPSAGAVWHFEVLPVSRRVWRVDGCPVRRWVIAPKIDVANTPAFAALAAQWLDPAGETDDADVLNGQREMSDSERVELRQHTRLAWVRPLPAALGLTAWLCIPITAMLLQRHLSLSVKDIPLAGLAVLTLLADLLLLDGVRQAQLLRADRIASRITIIRVEWKQDKDTKAADNQDEAENDDINDDITDDASKDQRSDVIEVLPQSGRVWTEQGKPALWRKVTP